MKEKVKKIKRKVDCPNCLYGNGIVADGRGSKCDTCRGSRKVYRKKRDEFNKQYGLVDN